jgi:hypothetical protein
MVSGGWRLGSVILVVVTVLLSGDVVRAAHAVATAPVAAGHRGGRARQSSAHVNHAAWYVGTTSAGTRIDFRLSPSAGRVRAFHFGSPALTCPDGVVTGLTMGDGNFPLRGLRIRHQTFSGVLQTADYTPSNADSPSVRVSGSFIDQQRVTGTLREETRGDCGYAPLTFTATRAGSLPARPTQGRGYSGLTVRGTRVWFRVSRSGRRVTAFRIATVRSDCKYSDGHDIFMLAKSHPAAGLRQDRDGVFGGVVSSRVTARGHPAGTRVRVSVLFLSPTEATGTVRPVKRTFGGRCGYETLPFRATLTN